MKGTLTISEDKDFKVQSFELSVSGEERIEIKTDQLTYKQSSIIFSKRPFTLSKVNRNKDSRR